MALDRHRHTLRESAPVSAYEAAWEETYSWLLKKQDNVFALPHNSVVKLKIDALKGVLDKTKITPDATSEVVASKIDTLVSELQAVEADEEPGEVKNFIDRTVEAFRSVSYNANQGAADELHGGGMGGMGGPTGDFGDEPDVDSEGGDEGSDSLPADLGIEPEGDQPEPPTEDENEAPRRRAPRP